MAGVLVQLTRRAVSLVFFVLAAVSAYVVCQYTNMLGTGTLVGGQSAIQTYLVVIPVIHTTLYQSLGIAISAHHKNQAAKGILLSLAIIVVGLVSSHMTPIDASNSETTRNVLSLVLILSLPAVGLWSTQPSREREVRR